MAPRRSRSSRRPSRSSTLRRFLRRRARPLIAGAALVVLLALAWSGWSVWQVAGDLRAARAAGEAMGDAVATDDKPELSRQAELLAEHARAAADHSDGWTWRVLGHTPVVGDDLEAVAAVSSSLDTAASGAIVPLASRLLDVDRIAVDGRLDTDLMEELRPQVRRGADALTEAAARVDGVRPDDYLGFIGDPVETWARTISDAAVGASDAASVLEVLPAMVGSERPQRILLVFESNAEIRATGGLPGSWSLVEASDGRLRVLRQGSGGGIDAAVPQPVPTSPVEQAIWGPQLGLYFRDATMTSDYPRAAELMRAKWQQYGGAPLDGIVSVDVVTVGYLLEGLGAIQVDGVTLDADNVVAALLNGVYERVAPREQDAVFSAVARALVDRLTTERIPSAIDVMLGLARGASEDRIHASWSTPAIADALAGTRIEGAVETESAREPVVDVTLNDATGSKMSYFLRHDVDVEAVDCGGGRQRLEGRMRLWQTVSPEEASGFSPYVTGAGRYGVAPGDQVVLARILGPVGGSIVGLRVDEEEVDPALAGIVDWQGRPVVTLALQPDSAEGALVTWAMVTGDRQTGNAILRVTPGVEEGTQSGSRVSACPA